MLTLDGIVIMERRVGETDKFIDVLTKENGVIEIVVKGAGKINGKSGSSTQLFAYSRFCVQLRKEKYYLNSAEPICIFYNLRNKLDKVSLAAYFSEMIKYSIEPQYEKNDVLRLFLNTLHFLENDKRPLPFLKSLFELRFVTEIGLMPNILGCCKCGCFEPLKLFFMISDGNFCCDSCFDLLEDKDAYNNYIKSDRSVLDAVRHIVLSDFDRLYNFKLSSKTQNVLSVLSERYVINHLDRNFKTLEFYKTLL